MNKKLLLIAGIFIILLFITFIFTLLSPQKKSQESSYFPSGSPLYSPSSAIEQSSNFNSVTQPVQISTAPQHFTPEEVARNFYSWYLTYPGVSALTKGAYNSYSYITDDFKRVIRRMAPYEDNDDPVFCTPNKLVNYTVLPATTTPDGRQGVIIRSVPEGKNLHKIILKNVNNSWLIDDTVCML